MWRFKNSLANLLPSYATHVDAPRIPVFSQRGLLHDMVGLRFRCAEIAPRISEYMLAHTALQYVLIS